MQVYEACASYDCKPCGIYLFICLIYFKYVKKAKIKAAPTHSKECGFWQAEERMF
jgi:hypothetical protein